MAGELAIAGGNQTALQRRQESAADPFEPQDWQGLMQLAKMVAATPFAPKDFQGKPEACAIAMMYGKQLGIGGLQAIQNVAVINGRPSIYGDAFWAIILSHPEFEDVVEKDEDTKAYVKLTRRGRTPKEVTFTQQDAQRAGLWGKQGPWTNYPKTMLLWRARTIAARSLFADALKGITSSYEAEDSGPVIEGSVASVTPAQVADLAGTAGPSPANGSQPSGTAKISENDARAFSRAYKQSGFTVEDAKRAIAEIAGAGIQSSLDVPTSKLEALMRWATRNPNWPNPAPEPSHDEKLCRDLFGLLSYDLSKQADAIGRHTKETVIDWPALAMELGKELPEDK